MVERHADFADPSFEGTIRLATSTAMAARTSVAGPTRASSARSRPAAASLKATLWQPGMSDAAGWSAYAGSIQLVDVNGDGRADLCGRGPDGLVCSLAP